MMNVLSENSQEKEVPASIDVPSFDKVGKLANSCPRRGMTASWKCKEADAKALIEARYIYESSWQRFSKKMSINILTFPMALGFFFSNNEDSCTIA